MAETTRLFSASLSPSRRREALSEGILRAVFAAVLVWTGAEYLRAKKPIETENANKA
jgi:hypothetical protein